MHGKSILSEEDHRRITEAIKQAEASTSGEIYCVVARRSDDYFFPSAFFSAVAIIIAMVFADFILGRGWEATYPAMLPAAGLLALATSLLFLILVPNFRILLVPRNLRYRRASANAVAQFLSHNIHTTTDRTGVLIFVSLQEQYAEIVADSGINAKVHQTHWNNAVASLTNHARNGNLADGFVESIVAVGADLKDHFPATGSDGNELDDRLVEI